MLSLILQSTNVIYLNGIGVGPGLFCCVFFWIKTLMAKPYILNGYLLNYRSKKDNYINLILILLSSIIISSVLTVLNNFSLSIFNIFIYFLTFFQIIKVKELLDKRKILKYFEWICYFAVIMGFLQFFMTTGIIYKSNFIREIFFNDPSENVYFNKDYYNRICSTFMEPSYYSTLLIPMYIYFYKKNNGFKTSIFLILVIFQVVFTKSSTAYLAIVVSTILLLLFNINKKSFYLIFICGVLGLIFIVLFMPNLLNEVIFSKLSSGSATTRYWWDNSAIEQFLNNVLFGSGYKNVRGSSIITSIMGQLGVYGLIAYCLMILYFIVFAIQNKKRNKFLTSFAIQLLSIFVCQIIACPDLDLSSFWLFIFLFLVLKDFRIKNKVTCKYGKTPVISFNS